MNRTLTTALAATTIFTLAPAAHAATVAVSKAHVEHQLESARSAQDRLQMHSDRFCSDFCERFKVDVGVVQGALQNFANQVHHGVTDDGTARLDFDRVAHQFASVRSALERMKWVASRQDDRWRRRVEIDVSIVDQVVMNLENHVKNSYRSQTKDRLAAERKTPKPTKMVRRTKISRSIFARR